MDTFDRAGIVNTINWIEEDTKQEIQKKQTVEYLRLKIKYEKAKWRALSDMYRTVEETGDNRDNCFAAMSKTKLCYDMGFISEKVCSEISNYLQEKIRRLGEK